MKAIICSKYGGPEVLRLGEIEKPVPDNQEVLIRIHTAAATAAGLAGRSGKPLIARLFMGLRKPKRTLGAEIAGVVEGIGKDVRRFKVGDEVFGIDYKTLGAYAEFVCRPAEAALEIKPPEMNFSESVAVIEGALTAMGFLRDKAKVQKGQKVLIYGASGSVGVASVQLAKYYGAEVTGVCSGANLELVKSLGADKVIDYTQEDFTRNGETYDVIFDTVGKRSFWQCKRSLSRRGIYLDAGNAATILAMLWTSLFGRKKAILTATGLRPVTKIREDLKFLTVLVAEGKMRAVIDRSYPLAQTAEAHRYVETGRKKGNVVLMVLGAN